MEKELDDLVDILNALILSDYRITLVRKNWVTQFKECKDSEKALEKYNAIIDVVNRGYYNANDCLMEIKKVLVSE